jgi:malonyl-CoA decarboxylase
LFGQCSHPGVGVYWRILVPPGEEAIPDSRYRRQRETVATKRHSGRFASNLLDPKTPEPTAAVLGSDVMNTSFFGELLQTISERGRSLIDRARDRRGDAASRSASLIELCEELLSGRGEASGVALAREILTAYSDLTVGPRIAFFEALATRFSVDRERIDTAVDAWTRSGTDEAAGDLHVATEPRRQELFRRLNLAPGGTASLVSMREDLMDALVRREDLSPVDQDFVHLFSSWFNRGFLVLRRIDWSTPAIVL